MSKDQDNKPATNWQFIDDGDIKGIAGEYIGPHWRYGYGAPDFSRLSINFPRPYIYNSDPAGWIPASIDPPEKGNYLAWEGKFWDRIYWDGETWKSKWPPQKWRPIVPPEEEGERFVLEQRVGPTDTVFDIIDTKTGETIAERVECNPANDILEYLNRTIEC